MIPIELYGVRDAAKRLGISERSVRRLIAAKQLRSVKALGRRLIPNAEIEAYVIRLVEESEAGHA